MYANYGDTTVSAPNAGVCDLVVNGGSANVKWDSIRMYRQAIITFIINRMKDCYEKEKQLRLYLINIKRQDTGQA